MLKIGITGGIGSGKTVVCKVFEQLGISVYYADEESKKLINRDVKLIAEIKKIFGEDIYTQQGSIDRKRLSEIVFKDENLLNKLNSIVHPAVLKHFLSWSETKKSTPYIMKEAAIMFEAGTNKDLDLVVMVSAPLELRIKRTMDRDKISREAVEVRMSKQMSEEEKIKRSDFVIYNDEEQLVVPQVLELHKLFLEKSNFTKQA